MSILLKKQGMLLSAVLSFALLAACGTSNNASPEQTGSASGQSPSPAASAAAPTVKTVTHAMGSTEITGTPKRIVVLEWTYAEDLIALGIQPVGAADTAGYKKWITSNATLGSEVVDVGTRQEPNLEAIAALKPDLIIAAQFRVTGSYDKLKQIAPTLAFNSYPAEGTMDQYTEMENTFKTIADLTGKSAEAEKVLQGLNQAYDAAKTKLKAAGKEGREFGLAQAYSNQNAAVLRIFTDNSTAVKILERIGLKNAYHAPKFEMYGYTQTSVEALLPLEKADFLYVVQKEDNVFEKQLKDNAAWKGLSFVKENRTYGLDPATWLFGGPLSAKAFVEQTADLLAK
jgi:ferric hydroxamate transport system substrate-binding protein